MKLFASSGSCSSKEYIIKGKVINKTTFVSDEFTETIDNQEFWNSLSDLAKRLNKFVCLMY